MMEKDHDAVAILKDLVKDDPEFDHFYQEAHVNVTVSQLIYDARKEANLTQAELAKRAGITQSIIAQLEDADYEGDCLTMLNRIAAALHKKVEIRFVAEPVVTSQKG